MKSNEKDDTIVDTSTLTHDDLQDAYNKLAQKYSKLKERNDHFNQKLHQEISQKKVLENTLSDIQSELDSINEVNAKQISQIEKRNEELRNKNQNLIMEKIVLENKIDDFCTKIHQLNEELKEVKGLLAVKAIKPRVSDTYAKSLEIENENLRSTINDIKEQMEELTVKYSESGSKVQELTERLECVQDNLESKKVELEEKIESLELLQEKVHELSTELTLLRNSAGPDDNNRKGNSLFAELDDQRQKMKRILQGERIHYQEMKKAYNSKEMEIRRLKRENLNIKSEIQACSNQLKRGEQLASNHRNIYVSHLECEKKNLESELRKMEERLADLAAEQKMHWVETFLTSASRDARDLKDKHYVLLREKTTLADNHSKTLRELAKARLHSTKLKVLLGRIVDEFKIKIDESQYDDLEIDEGIFENLRLEEYEALDSSNPLNKQDDESEQVNGMLNESTIILLGGREKLGNAIPSIQESGWGLRNQQIAGENVQDFGSIARNFRSCSQNVSSTSSSGFANDFGSTSQNLESSIQKPMKMEEESANLMPVKLEKVEMLTGDEKKSVASDKENAISCSSFKTPKTEVQSPLKSKTIQFSNKIETRVIDSTKEGYEQSKEARKRPAFTVKRIVIPSKTPKTS